MSKKVMQETIACMSVPGKGILAADESGGTIAKRFQTIAVESTETSRRDYRELLFTAPELNRSLHGVILFEETLGQSTQGGKRFVDVLTAQGIVPGIKVDKGLIPLAGAPGEKVTQGLDGLSERLEKYKAQGTRFAKWRAVYSVSNCLPSCQAIKTQAEMLARYAAICQSVDIVPIVEPEVLMDGNHTLARSEEVHLAVLTEVFNALFRHRVELELIILKPSMVISGADAPSRAGVHEVAEATLRTLRRTVPSAVPSINFLSGGQGDEEATAHLDAMNKLSMSRPWQLSFSYGRALQAPALHAWKGKAENFSIAQNALLKRARLNAAASIGQYSGEMEKTQG